MTQIMNKIICKNIFFLSFSYKYIPITIPRQAYPLGNCSSLIYIFIGLLLPLDFYYIWFMIL